MVLWFRTFDCLESVCVCDAWVSELVLYVLLLLCFLGATRFWLLAYVILCLALRFGCNPFEFEIGDCPNANFVQQEIDSLHAQFFLTQSVDSEFSPVFNLNSRIFLALPGLPWPSLAFPGLLPSYAVPGVARTSGRIPPSRTTRGQEDLPMALQRHEVLEQQGGLRTVANDGERFPPWHPVTL